MNSNIGFIGLGTMGKWMAINLLKKGFHLIVFDIRPEPIRELLQYGASAGDDPSDVAKRSNIVMMSLPDTKVVEDVVFGPKGLIEGFTSGAILVDLSTIHYLATLRIESKLRERGISFIDAPVSGMEARAKDGTLTVMVGGDLGAYEKVRPLLNAIGNNIIYMGKSGNGQLTKLINQIFFNISCAAMAEILPMAVKLGLDPERVCKVVTTGTGRTFALEFFAPYILKNDFTPGYPLISAYKDMESAAEISSQMKIPLPVFFGAMQTYQMALAQGLGNENKGAMIKVWERMIGVEVRRNRG